MKAAKNGNALIVQYLVNHNVDVSRFFLKNFLA